MKQDKKINTICDARLSKYFDITEKALSEVKKHVNEKRKDEAKEIIDMASRYLEDAKYFKQQGHYVNAFAALNYSHGWLDTVSRIGIFDVHDSNIFVVK
jgi:uncharacterized protein